MNNEHCQKREIDDALRLRRPEIIAICRRFKVMRLDTFDSGANGVEGIGFLVDFLEYGPWHNAEAHCGLRRALEGIFEEYREIGYVSVDALANPHVKRRVEKTRTPFYFHEA